VAYELLADGEDGPGVASVAAMAGLVAR